MKRILLGVLIGLMVGIAVPATAHRDKTVSKHLYNHIHGMAHRLIDVENVVWKDLPGFLACLNDTGVYVCPISSTHVVASATALCAGRVAVWRTDGALDCPDTNFIRTQDGKTEWDRLLCDALQDDLNGPRVKALCEQ